MYKNQKSLKLFTVRTPLLQSPYGFVLLLCAAVWLLSFSFLKTAFESDKLTATALMAFAFAGILLGVYQKQNHFLTSSQVLYFILAAGFLIKLIYIWSTPYNISPHDLGKIVQGDNLTGGHLGYIGYLAHYGHLPDFDPRKVWSFYNPPLYHTVSALWLKFNLLLGASWEIAVENLRILTLLYSCLTVVVIRDILDFFDIKLSIKNLLTALISFFPTLTWFAGSLSSDSLALLFSCLIIKHTLLWNQRRTRKQIVLLALAIGLGMLTKLNCGLLAVGTALIFLFALVDSLKKREGNFKKYLGQFLLFGIICVPLGLWWVLRCKVLFDMPINYVPILGEASPQYIGTATVWQRLGLPTLQQLSYAKMKFDPTLDTNIWLSLFRTALFDEKAVLEFPTRAASALGFGLFCGMIALAVLMNFLYFWVLADKKSTLKKEYKWYTAVLYALLLLSYLKFCFDYPYICTMNFRYIACTILFPCIGTGVYFNHSKPSITLQKVIYLGITCVSFLSVLVYWRYCVSL